MTHGNLPLYIRRQKGGLPSTADLVAFAKAAYNDALIPSKGNDMKKRHLARVYGDRIDVTMDTCLHHLLDIGIVHRWCNGGEWLIIHERLDEIVNDQDLETLIDEETDRLLADLEALALADGGGSGLTKREVIAEELDVGLDEIGDELQEGDDIWIRREKLEQAINAVEDEDAVEKGGDYAPILVIRNPYRYELTEKAVELAEA